MNPTPRKRNSTAGWMRGKFVYGLHAYAESGKIGRLNMRPNFKLIPGLAVKAGSIGGKASRRRKA